MVGPGSAPRQRARPDDGGLLDARGGGGEQAARPRRGGGERAGLSAAQPLAEQREAEDGHDDHEAREDDLPRRAAGDANLRGADQLAELGQARHALGHRNAYAVGDHPDAAADEVAEEAKGAREHQRGADLEGHEHRQQRRQVAANVADHNLGSGGAKGAGGVNVGPRGHQLRLGADHLGRLGPARKAHANDEGWQPELDAHGGDGGQRHDQHGDGEGRVGERAQGAARQPGRPAGDGADQHAERKPDGGHDCDEQQRGPQRPEQTAKKIAAGAVGAERERPRLEGREGRAEGAPADLGHKRALKRIAGRQRRPEERQEQQHSNDAGADKQRGAQVKRIKLSVSRGDGGQGTGLRSSCKLSARAGRGRAQAGLPRRCCSGRARRSRPGRRRAPAG